MKQSILLVDDESGIRKVLSITLRDYGYEVYTAANFDEAIQVFEQENPQVVLTDIKMPGRDGIELLDHIKQHSPETEVIMITGHGDMELAILSLKKRATDFITKPVSDEALEISLQRAFDRIEMRRLLQQYTNNLERMVEEKTRELLKAERLAAIGDTVAGLAHAIKNIAGGLEAGLFVVEKGQELDESEYREQGWGMIAANVTKIKELSLNLLDYAKPSQLRIIEADPNKPAEDVHQLMASEASERGIRFLLETADTPNKTPLDVSAVHRCLLNLVVNAFEACLDQPGGQANTEVIISVMQEQGRGAIYQVRDNGPGIHHDIRPKIFNRFFTTKGGKGAGLGLMITKKMVEEHGGTITVDSEPGQGAVFTIAFSAE